MKKLTLLFTVLFAALYINAQNVAINNDASIATPSAMLDVKSTTKGFMMPRMTSAQRTTIQNPALGLLVFDTDTKTIWAHDGSSWKNLYTSGGGLTLPFSQTVNTIDPVFQLENNGTGNTMMLRNNSNGTGLHLFSQNGTGIDVSSIGNIGIKATSWTSNAIHAYTDNPNNTIPTIRANNFGGGRGLYANSSVDDGIYGTTAGVSKAGVKGETSTAAAYGVFGNHTGTGGVGVYGKADIGIAVQAASQNGTGLLASSGTGRALEVNGSLKIAGGNTNPGAGKVLTSDASGNATWQQPAAEPKIAFRATGVHPNYQNLPNLNDTRVQFNNQQYDYSGNYIAVSENGDPSGSSEFYVPVAGLYHFESQVSVASLNDAISKLRITFRLKRNGIVTTIAEYLDYEPSEIEAFAFLSVDYKLQVGDRIFVAVEQYNSGETTALLQSYDNSTWFSGRIIFKD
ncbi:MAG TPA: hypothetical protein VF144_00510 [Chitinophagaceae bacterium]